MGLAGEFPIPPKDFDWQVKENSSDYAYYNHNNGSYNSSNLIELKGKLWTYVTKDETRSPNLPNAYDKFLKDDGWHFDVNSNGYHVWANATEGGPGGSSWGFLKLEDNKLNYVTFSKVNEFSTDEFECPCESKYTIFLSDPIDLNEIEKYATSTN